MFPFPLSYTYHSSRRESSTEVGIGPTQQAPRPYVSESLGKDNAAQHVRVQKGARAESAQSPLRNRTLR
ncbi:MAG TPA: hypothetical protein PK493_16590, partial [Pseudomonadota bacterium]|nr:hypothetical protein [Pseudomonadota bacterium]